MNYYLAVLKKYAVFNGRSPRAEYWYFFLFNIIISIVLSIVDGIIGNSGSTAGVGLLGAIYSLALIIPGIAVGIRRLHDTNHSGWWLLISLIPIVGIIWLIVLMATDSNPGENKYGLNPKIIVTNQNDKRVV